MPSVKLAGGFDATIRTMFKEQRCQSRYGRIENASYPISPSMRMQLQSALEWAGSTAQKNITWINTDQNEIMLAYPSSLPDVPISYTATFKQSGDKTTAFSVKAGQFIKSIQQTKKPVQTPMHRKSGYLCFEKLTRRAQKLSTPAKLTLANWKNAAKPGHMAAPIFLHSRLAVRKRHIHWRLRTF